MDAEHDDDPLIDDLLAEVAWLRRLARRLAHDEASADDLAQGAIVAALEREPERGRSLRPWLARVVDRLARHRRRADGRRAEREARAAVERAPTARGADELLARLEHQEALARAVRALPEPYRTIILRRFYEGQSPAEIARATHTTAATVRSQLARGLERLRRSLASEVSEGRGNLFSFLILATGSDSGWLPRLAAETIVMHTGTKMAIGAALAAATIFTATRWNGSGDASLYPDGASSSLDGRPLAPRVEQLQEEAALPGVVPRTRLAAAIEPQETSTPSEAHVAAEAEAFTTRICALVVDDFDAPLVGATLLAMRADGRPRGSAPSAPSDVDGRAVLVLRDDELRKSGLEVFTMMFAVRADGRATQFVECIPKLHDETDLGRVALAPGGALIGTAIDPHGAPIEGATVLAAEPNVVGELDALRLEGPNLGIPRPRARSAASGRFRIEGVALTEARLWLHRDGSLWTIDRALPVAASGVTDAGQIVIEPAPKERSITGRVRTPSGANAGGAHVWFQRAQGFDEERVIADSEGRFVIVPKAAESFELIARDPEGEHTPSATVLASLGVEGLVLELRPRHVIAVRVTDPEGHPIDQAALAPLVDLDAGHFVGGGRMLPGEEWTRTDVDGHAEVFVPTGSFKVTASKRGFEGQRFGPYEPGRAPSTLEVILEREPAIVGRVLCDGLPVADARITIGQRLEDFVPIMSGFPTRFFVNQSHGIVSDAEGRFVCPVDGEWVDVTVIARSETHATGELELRLEAGKGAQDVEVPVTRGGALEGVVLPPAGRMAEGLVVVASRGDGEPRWTRADADGRYRLARLTPGPWRVEGALNPPSNEILSVAQSPGEAEFNWNVTIQDGVTADFDVDARGRGDVEFTGRVTLDGAPAAGWSVELRASVGVAQRKALPSNELAPDGSFAMVAPAGTYYLRVGGPLEGTRGGEVVREIELVGPRFDWTYDIETKWFEETFAEGVQGAKLTGGQFFEGGDSHEIVLNLDSERRARARVPTGRWSLRTFVAVGAETSWKWVRSVQH